MTTVFHIGVLFTCSFVGINHWIRKVPKKPTPKVIGGKIFACSFASLKVAKHSCDSTALEQKSSAGSIALGRKPKKPRTTPHKTQLVNDTSLLVDFPILLFVIV
jgi:hypothetical protein